MRTANFYLRNIIVNVTTMALCFFIASTANAEPIANNITEVAQPLVVWPLVQSRNTGFHRNLAKKMGKQIAEGIGAQQKKLKPAQRRLLKRKMRRCKPFASDECVLGAAQSIENVSVLAVIFTGTPRKFDLTLKLLEGDPRIIVATSSAHLKRREAKTAVGELAVLLLQNRKAAAEASQPEPLPDAGAIPDAVAGEVVVVDPVTPANWEVEADDAYLLHAEALGMELDGDAESAMGNLRKAQAIEPKDETIAFDLARLALEHHTPQFETDVAGFLAIEPNWPDARLLRAYVLLKKGDRAGAAKQLQVALAENSSDEAMALSQTVQSEKQPIKERMVYARLRLGTQVDSNVTVTGSTPAATATNPDPEGALLGVRGVADLLVEVTPIRGAFELGILGAANFAGHLNSRTATTIDAVGTSDTETKLAKYDSFASVVSVKAKYSGKGYKISGRMGGSEVFINDFGRNFSQSVGGSLGAQFQLGPIWVGPVVSTSYNRFFVKDGSEPKDNRDGVYIDGGVVAVWSRGNLWTVGRAVFEAELTKGRRQQERGGRFQLTGGWNVANLRLSIGIGYNPRHFIQSKNGPDTEAKRWDHRVAPSVRMGYDLTESFEVYGSYSYLQNISTHDASYKRHLGQLGVGAQW